VSPATRTPPRPIRPTPQLAAPILPATAHRRPFLLGAMALAPASALSRKPLWQSLAQQLPAGGVLIVTPNGDGRLSNSLEVIMAAFQAHGHPVTTITLDALRERQLSLF
jgi:hypothetical protein